MVVMYLFMGNILYVKIKIAHYCDVFVGAMNLKCS